MCARRWKYIFQCRSESIKHTACSNELTGTRTSSGACGLIRRYAQNLTNTWHVRRETKRLVFSVWLDETQVLHGCRQLVSWDVGLSPATSATPTFSCHHLVGHFKRTASDKLEEGGDDVKSSWPLCVGLHTCYNGTYNGMQRGDS